MWPSQGLPQRRGVGLLTSSGDEILEQCLECPSPGLILPSQRSNHLQISHRDVTFKCAACEESGARSSHFISFSSVKSHVISCVKTVVETAVFRTVLLPPGYPDCLVQWSCGLCPSDGRRVWLSERQAIEHVGQVHSNFYLKKNRWSQYGLSCCRICGKEINIRDIIIHIRKCHSPSLFADQEEEERNIEHSVPLAPLLNLNEDIKQESRSSSPEIICIKTIGIGGDDSRKEKQVSLSTNAKQHFDVERKESNRTGRRRHNSFSSSHSSSSTESDEERTEIKRKKDKDKKIKFKSSKSLKEKDKTQTIQVLDDACLIPLPCIPYEVTSRGKPLFYSCNVCLARRHTYPGTRWQEHRLTSEHRDAYAKCYSRLGRVHFRDGLCSVDQTKLSDLRCDECKGGQEFGTWAKLGFHRLTDHLKLVSGDPVDPYCDVCCLPVPDEMEDHQRSERHRQIYQDTTPCDIDGCLARVWRAKMRDHREVGHKHVSWKCSEDDCGHVEYWTSEKDKERYITRSQLKHWDNAHTSLVNHVRGSSQEERRDKERSSTLVDESRRRPNKSSSQLKSKYSEFPDSQTKCSPSSSPPKKNEHTSGSNETRNQHSKGGPSSHAFVNKDLPIIIDDDLSPPRTFCSSSRSKKKPSTSPPRKYSRYSDGESIRSRREYSRTPSPQGYTVSPSYRRYSRSPSPVRYSRWPSQRKCSRSPSSRRRTMSSSSRRSKSPTSRRTRSPTSRRSRSPSNRRCSKSPKYIRNSRSKSPRRRHYSRPYSRSSNNSGRSPSPTIISKAVLDKTPKRKSGSPEEEEQSHQETLFCDICQIHCVDDLQLKLHMIGMKHKWNLDKVKTVTKSVAKLLEPRIYCETCKGYSKEQHYLCKICGVHSESKISYWDHMKGKKHKDKVHKDKVQDKVHKDKVQDKVHKDKVQEKVHKDKVNNSTLVGSKSDEHSPRTVVQGTDSSHLKLCPVCEETFEEYEDLKHHVEIHHKLLISCKSCKVQSYKPFLALTCGELLLHLHEDHHKPEVRELDLRYYGDVPNWGQGYIRCSLCIPSDSNIVTLGALGLWFINSVDKQMLQSHVKNYHSLHLPNFQAVARLGCQVCSVEFVKETAWQDHLRSHKKTSDPELSKVSSKCTFCFQTVGGGDKMESHLRSSHDRLAFKCKICPPDERYPYASFLDIRSHLNLKHKSSRTEDIIFPVEVECLAWVTCKRVDCHFHAVGMNSDILESHSMDQHGVKGGLQEYNIFCRFCDEEESVDNYDDSQDFEFHLKKMHSDILGRVNKLNVKSAKSIKIRI